MREKPNLSNKRIIQKQLVYVIGLSASLVKKESLLTKFEYFGQYGKVLKLVINKNKAYNANGPSGPSYSAYITFSTAIEASLAILSLDNSTIDNHLIRASFGTTKYCSSFLKNLTCFNKDCLYLHENAEEADILERDEMATHKEIFASQILYAIQLAEIFLPEVKQRLTSCCKSSHTYFPNTGTIYDKEIIIQQECLSKNNKCDLSSEINNTASSSPMNSSKSLSFSFSSNNLTTLNSQKNIQLYKKRENSRFEFGNNNNPQNSNIEIPCFVSKIVDKMCSRFTFFRKHQNHCEDFIFLDKFLVNEVAAKNPWAVSILNLSGKKRPQFVNNVNSTINDDEKCKLLDY
jgi:CCR4-NOT transcription complex subunit 4